MALTRGAAGPFSWTVAGRPRADQQDSGDGFLVIDRGRGPLVAVLDGLGHGAEAADAVRAGVEALRRDPDRPLPMLLEDCATALRATRGVVVTLCAFDQRAARLTWTAIGNVAGVVVDRDGPARGRIREVVQVGGILGGTTLRPRLETVALRPESLLVLATDGIDSHFRQALDSDTDPDVLAAEILSRYAVDDDDALVLVGRYRASESALAKETTFDGVR